MQEVAVDVSGRRRKREILCQGGKNFLGLAAPGIWRRRGAHGQQLREARHRLAARGKWTQQIVIPFSLLKVLLTCSQCQSQAHLFGRVAPRRTCSSSSYIVVSVTPAPEPGRPKVGRRRGPGVRCRVFIGTVLYFSISKITVCSCRYYTRLASYSKPVA